MSWSYFPIPVNPKVLQGRVTVFLRAEFNMRPPAKPLRILRLTNATFNDDFNHMTVRGLM